MASTHRFIAPTLSSSFFVLCTLPTLRVNFRGPSNSAKHMLPRQAAALAKPTAPVSVPIPPRRLRQKKGPKRIKKQMMAKSAEQLDQEMEDYRAEADLTSLDS